MDYTGRLNRLRQTLGQQDCEALLVEHPANLLYLTGLELSTGKLLIAPHDASLIVDGRYEEAAKKQTTYPVLLLKDNILQDWIVEAKVHQLGFDQMHTTYQAYTALSHIAEKLKKQETYLLEIIPLDGPVQLMRMIKDEDEISLLRKAAKLGYEGFKYASSILQEGISETEVAIELEFFWKKRGASRLAFESIIAFGPNSSMPHYRAGSTILKHHTTVLIDIGLVLSHYHSDMTRVVFFGSPPPLMQTIYSIVEEAKARAQKLCRPGTLIGDLDRAAREWIASKGYGPNFTHSLGHGLGLDIHEPPILRSTGLYRDMPLQKGMVITIEPGIYLPDIGGVRLEDTLLITENGHENLTTLLR